MKSRQRIATGSSAPAWNEEIMVWGRVADLKPNRLKVFALQRDFLIFWAS